MKPWIIRSAPNTVSSIASRMCSKVVLANGLIDGTRNALLISTSTLPYALSVSSTRLFTCASSVMSVPTDTARRPEVGDLLGDVLEPLDRAGREHQIGALLGTSPRQRGAQRGTDAADDDDLVLQKSGHLLAHHSFANLLLAQRDPRAPVVIGDLVRLVVRQRVGHLVDVDQLDGRAVGLGQLTRHPLPAELQVALAVAERLAPSWSRRGCASETTMRILPSGSACA